MPFTVSNVSKAIAGLSYDSDILLYQGDNQCKFDTNKGEFSCQNSVTLSVHTIPVKFLVAQQDVASSAAGPSPEVGVFIARNVELPATSFKVTGGRPLVIVAQGTVHIAGQVLANGKGIQAGPGGAGGDWDVTRQNGHGPGAGRFDPSAQYPTGGGAGHCGPGSDGHAYSGAFGPAGPAYGNANNIPLFGGSSGAAGQQADEGAGGGAVQISAGVSITIDSGAWINVGGGGGKCQFITSGGGSGGALLLEAPTVTVNGVLAANGGGAADWACLSSSTVPDATPDNVPAISGTDGAGAAAALPPGPGGGAAAGFIRINTSSGSVDLGASAIVSPDNSTGCTSSGMLQ